jgi:hypothetical protein
MLAPRNRHVACFSIFWPLLCCSDKKTDMASVAGGIQARVVWHDRKGIGLGGAGGGHVGVLWPTLEREQSCFVHVTKPTMLEPRDAILLTAAQSPTDCSKIRLFADDAQRRLGVVSPSAVAVYYFGTKGGLFATESPAPLDWKAVPSFRDVLFSRLRAELRASPTPEAYTSGMRLRLVTTALTELTQDGASESVAEVVTDTRGGDYHWTDPWRAAFDSLAPGPQLHVRSVLRADVESGVNVRAGALARAFVFHDFSEKRHHALLLSHARALIPAVTAGAEDAMRVFGSLLKFLAQTDLDGAATLADTFVSSLEPAAFQKSLAREKLDLDSPSNDVLAIALSVLRHSGRSCANVGALFEVFAKRSEDICQAPGWFCKDKGNLRHVCVDQERRMPPVATESWATLTKRLTSDSRTDSLLEEFVLARGLRIPISLERSIARQTYAWARSAGGKVCEHNGHLCEEVPLNSSACADAPVVKPISGEIEELHFDDVNRVRWFVDPFLHAGPASTLSDMGEHREH